MWEKAGNLVLPRYNSSGLGPMGSPNGGSPTGAVEKFSQGRAVDCGDSILLDIEGGSGTPLTKSGQSWWRTDVITSPIKTAVFTHLGSAVSSGWSRARGVLLASSITSYIRRVPTLEKPFDLKEIHHPVDPNDI